MPIPIATTPKSVDQRRGTRVSCGARRRRHHHAARRVLEHEVDRAAEDPPAAAVLVVARRAHHDDLAVAPLGLLDDRPPGPPARARAVRPRPRRRRRRSRAPRRAASCALRSAWPGSSASSGSSSGTSSTVSATIAPPRSAARRQARSTAASDSRRQTTGTSTFRYSSATRRPDHDRRAHRLHQRRMHDPAPVDRVHGEAGREPAEPGPARGRLLLDHDEPRQRGPEPAEDGEQRPVHAAQAQVRPRPEDQLLVAALVAQRHDRGVRDREREHRAERVHRPEEARLAGQEHDRSGSRPRRRAARATAS